MAVVTIKNLQVRTRIGIEPHELRSDQEIFLDVAFEYDARGAAKADDIGKAVDYKALTDKIRALAAAQRFRLLEKFASDVLALVSEDRRVKRAWVTATKPRALPHASGVSVTVTSEK